MDMSTFSEFMYNSFGFNEDFFIKRSKFIYVLYGMFDV